MAPITTYILKVGLVRLSAGLLTKISVIDEKRNVLQNEVFNTCAVADVEVIQGVRLNPPPPPLSE